PDQLREMTTKVCTRYFHMAVGFEQKRATYVNFVPQMFNSNSALNLNTTFIYVVLIACCLPLI
ncbi:hypothetical protein, partial [Virgibacillus pantothenticus]|uniref:hypothetical protein n=1 Tax=Virgibacillus pantothenticus TaxID=1473 RepID=UPI0025B06D3C